MDTCRDDLKNNSQEHSGGFFDNIMGWKPAFFATMNACMYASTIDDITCPKCHTRIVTYITNNEAGMSPGWAKADRSQLEDKIRKYLKKLDGLQQLTIPISDIAQDLGMTEECVIKILEGWEIKLDEEENLNE